MNVDEPCAPERFRYWDLKEAVTSIALYGDSIGSVNRARASRPAEAGDFRRKWRALGVWRGSRALEATPEHTTCVVVDARSSLDSKVAVSCGCP